MKVRFVPPARQEVREAFRRYESERAGLGAEFSTDLAEAVEWVCKNALGPRLRGRRSRYWSLRRFPYVVVYQVLPDAIRIVAITHTSRRPGYWKNRL